ncbi:MAG: ketoacyl-ACP synthase III [Oligoflexia bacterium]|nr:ketoacyl-ACP synthase III [Oligoflexia bacterium]
MSFHKPNKKIFIRGPVACLPEKKVSNEDLVRWMGRDIRASWIEHRTGIQSRHWVKENESCSDLADATAKKLFTKYPEQKEKIRNLVLATISGDYPTPPTAPLVQHRLGLENIGAVDLTAACAGFVTGLHACSQFCVATEEDQLLIASEIRSKFLAKDDLGATALFGDGAASCIISLNASDACFEYIASQTFSEGSVADIIAIQAGGSRMPYHEMKAEEDQYLKMKKGATLFIKAAEGMAECATIFMNRIGKTLDDISWIVPHQANLHLVRDVTRRLNVPQNKVVETVQFTGNTSGASVGIALSHLYDNVGVSEGSFVLLISAGGGGLAACALLRAC